MKRELPAISLPAFGDELHRLVPHELSDATLIALYRHYEELRRWNRLDSSLLRPGQRLTLYVDPTSKTL